jgi:histidine triad (HIT) family protein
MPTIFTKIINREIPSHIVWENEEFISFLDITPVKKGHLLLVPKVEIDKVYDLEDDVHTKLFAKGKEMAKKMDQALQSKKPEMQVARVGYVVEGFGVPHTHLHLVPLSASHDLNPQNAYQAGPEELAEMREFYKALFAE